MLLFAERLLKNGQWRKERWHDSLYCTLCFQTTSPAGGHAKREKCLFWNGDDIGWVLFIKKVRWKTKPSVLVSLNTFCSSWHHHYFHLHSSHSFYDTSGFPSQPPAGHRRGNMVCLVDLHTLISINHWSTTLWTAVSCLLKQKCINKCKWKGKYKHKYLRK